MDFSFLDEITQRYQAAGYFPSAVCHVFDETGTRYCKAFGCARTDSWFDMASVSKLITTTLLLFLMDAGQLSPDSHLAHYLPQGRLGPITRQRLQGVTVRQAMTHTSGILPWFPFYADGRDFYVVLERALAGSGVEPGTAYSDLNFMLLGRVFTCITGLSLREGLEQYIKVPLGIPNLSYGPIDPALAVPSCYGNQIEQDMCATRGLSFGAWRPNGVPVQGTCNDGNAHYFFGGASGHAGIFATSASMVRLGQYYMTTEKPAFLAAMDTTVGERGLGFDKCDVFPAGCGHSGFTGTSLWFSRSHHIGAVLLTNRLYRTSGESGNTSDYRRAIHRALLAATAE